MCPTRSLRYTRTARHTEQFKGQMAQQFQIWTRMAPPEGFPAHFVSKLIVADFTAVNPHQSAESARVPSGRASWFWAHLESLKLNHPRAVKTSRTPHP